MTKLTLPSSVLASDLETLPLARASTPPATWYADPEVLEFERRAIFRRTWQYDGPAAAVASPGSWHVCAAEATGLPLLAVRGADDTLRALHNVCRHRAGPLANVGGKGRALVCRYHGWSYTLDGKLAGTPHLDGIEGFDRGGCRLPEASAAAWHGMLYTHGEAGAPPLAETLAGVDERIRAHYDLSKMRYWKRVAYDIDCDWKVYVDNYLEGYHVNMVHPELAQVLDVSNYRYEATSRWSLQHSPLQERGADRGGNPYGVGGGGWAYYFFVFPNLMLNIVPGRVQVNAVIPLTPGRCRVLFDYYYEAGLLADAARLQSDLEFSDRVQQEDIDVCVAVQRGLASGSYERGRYAPSQESALHHFHDQLRSAYRAATTG